MDIDLRLEVCGKYSAVYRDSLEEELIEYKKVNRARFNANSRLRIFADKHNKQMGIIW